MAFLKNILANESAMTAGTPAALIDTGACSLDEPEPKFLPPRIISPLECSLRSIQISCGNDLVRIYIITKLPDFPFDFIHNRIPLIL